MWEIDNRTLRVTSIYHRWESRKCTNNRQFAYHIIIYSSHDYTRDKKDDRMNNSKIAFTVLNGAANWNEHFVPIFSCPSTVQECWTSWRDTTLVSIFNVSNINNKGKQCTAKRNRVQWHFPPLLFPPKACPFLCSELAIMFTLTPLFFVKSRTGDLTEDALSAATYIN